MNIQKYSERLQGFIQSAQTQALSRGHQRFMPEHLLKVMLDDSEGMAAKLIRDSGGDPRSALQAVNAELDKTRKVEGAGAGQLYVSAEVAKVFQAAEMASEKAGDSFVTAEMMLLGFTLAESSAQKILK